MSGPTRKDVADYAGVSEATVSRVMNQSEGVRPEKVRLVREAAEKLGYRPDKYASALRRKGTGVIIFLEYRRTSGYQWPEIDVFNWFYADILHAVVEAVGETLYHLELRTVDSLEQIGALARECDGILAFNVEESAYAEAVASCGVPYVCAHHTEDLGAFSRCSTDNAAGGELMGHAFRRAGHSSVAYVSGYLDVVNAHRRRLEGFRRGFGGDVRLIEVEIGIEGGVSAAERLKPEIDSGRISGICAVNDLTALGIIRKLGSAGIDVPGSCVVAGYDNLPVGLGFSYTIPTVDLRLRRLYKRAVGDLVAYMRKATPADSMLEPVLVPGCLLDPANSQP